MSEMVNGGMSKMVNVLQILKISVELPGMDNETKEPTETVGQCAAVSHEDHRKRIEEQKHRVNFTVNRIFQMFAESNFTFGEIDDAIEQLRDRIGNVKRHTTFAIPSSRGSSCLDVLELVKLDESDLRNCPLEIIRARVKNVE